CGIGSALLDYNYKFVKRYFIALVQSLLAIGILILLFVKKIGIYSTPYAHVFSFLTISLIYAYIFLKNGYRFKSPLPVINRFIKEYFHLLLPIVFSWFFVWLIRFTDIFIASFLKSGSISYLSYCQRINLYTSVIANVVCSIYFPVLSRLSSSKENSNYLVVFDKGLQTLFTISLSFTLFIFLFSYQIIEILFQHGNFLNKDTIMVSKLLRYYFFALLCAPMGSYFSIVYFSYRKTKPAMVYSIISSSINIVLNVILGYYIGIIGVVTASSIAFLAGNIMQILNIKRVNPEYRLLNSLQKLYKSFFAGVVTFLIYVFVNRYFNHFYFDAYIITKIIYLGICFISFLIVFTSLSYFLNVEVVREAIKKALKK
ncbi:MAG: lipid II flippase MurJ, partial [Promethearchaeota archaeon]